MGTNIANSIRDIQILFHSMPFISLDLSTFRFGRAKLIKFML